MAQSSRVVDPSYPAYKNESLGNPQEPTNLRMRLIKQKLSKDLRIVGSLERAKYTLSQSGIELNHDQADKLRIAQSEVLNKLEMALQVPTL